MQMPSFTRRPSVRRRLHQLPLPARPLPHSGPEKIDDLDEVDILEHLPATSDQIRDALEDGASGVLVHCASGKSRSASVVIAYLMRYERLPYTEAFRQVKLARPVIAPNTGFTQQLVWYGDNGCPRTLREVGSGARPTTPNFPHSSDY